MARVVGADGCRAGWIALALDTETGGIAPTLFHNARALLHQRPRPAVVAIDIPIGLPDAGPRACDREARRRLGRPRASSVFPAPIRPALDARTRAEASRSTQRIDGRGVGAQAFGLYDKIRDVDADLREHSALRGRVREVHPEVSFRAMNAGRAMRASKKTPAGQRARRRLVERHFPGAFRDAQRRFPRSAVADDDILDALAALWTAARIERREAVTLPGASPRDAAGLRMEIVY